LDFNTETGTIIIDYPLNYNTIYQLTANDFNRNTYIIFTITKKVDNKTYKISDIDDNINPPIQLPYRFRDNVKLTVIPSQ
jgi:hypothetical protein|tara:strand:- start:7382 stop:7621 length:240 start_codon:yes stop_codon:yes gene_type:complete